MVEAEQPPEEDWENSQSKVWSLPLYSIGMIDSTAEDDGFSRELEFSPELYEGPDLLAIVAGTSALQSAALPTTVSPSRNSQAPGTSTDSSSDLSQPESSSSHKFIRNRPPVASTETLSHPPRSWGKKSKRQSATIRDPLIQTQVSPLAGGGARAYQPVKPQKVLPVATVPQTAKTQESTVRHPSRRAETNTAPRGSQGLADSYVKDSIGKAKWRAGAAPDSYLRLPHNIDRFQEIVTELTQKSVQPITNFRDYVVQVTGAYLTVGYRGARVVLIWGDGIQVLAAHTLLKTMITQVNQERATSHHPGWTRINSHSIVRVDVAKTKNARTSQLDALRKEPKVAPDMTLCFLWPRNGPSLDYCLSIHRQLFDSIRLQYDMNIYTKTDAWGFLFFSGGDERALLEMPRRARDLWKTMSLQFETEIKVCLIEPPHPEIMRRDVILQEYSDMIKPYLSGLQLPIEQAGMWEKKRVEARQDNKVIIVDRLKRALSLVPRFHGFRQMRAKFGSFVLKGYQKPKGPDEPLMYPDFRDLVVETSDRGRLCPGLRLSQNQLISRVTGAGHLLAPAGCMPLSSLTKVQPRFSASFEYKIRDNQVICIEANYTLPRGSEEFEVNEVRCFKPRSIGGTGESERPMQISMIDFERSDWQLEIKALDLLTEEETPPDVETFKRKLSFVWNESAHSITSVPERMSKFPLGAPLCWFVEKSAIEFHVKETNLVFELARYVKYNVSNGRILKTPDESWGGTLFDPDWDTMLGENTELDGTQFTREACLSAFFPPAEGAEVDEEVQLGVFMSALHQIARMLGSSDNAVTNILDVNLGTLF